MPREAGTGLGGGGSKPVPPKALVPLWAQVPSVGLGSPHPSSGEGEQKSSSPGWEGVGLGEEGLEHPPNEASLFPFLSLGLERNARLVSLGPRG